MVKTYTVTPAMMMAPNAPGDQVPTLSRSAPPRMGAMIRVELSMDVARPRMPPISSGATALVSVLESKVLRMPPDNEVGVNTTNSQKTEGANAQPSNETVINATAKVIKTSSRNFLVKRPTKKPCTITDRTTATDVSTCRVKNSPSTASVNRILPKVASPIPGVSS